MNASLFLLPLLLLALPAAAHGPAAADNADTNTVDDDHEGITLSATQQQLAGIRLRTLTAAPAAYQWRLPAELTANAYTRFQITPRVASVVVRRHVSLGDEVDSGAALVTLFSDEVASAQGAYRVAEAEQRRVQQLGRATVGERRAVEAQVALEAARGRLQAFGLTAAQWSGRGTLGEYTLTAPSAGRVISDDFVQGQQVAPGSALLELADEQTLWALAQLPPGVAHDWPAAVEAEVSVNGITVPAQLLQVAHLIDPVTRTQVARFSLTNPDHRLHPGQFAQVSVRYTLPEPVLTVPDSALMRDADGQWQVFIEAADEPGSFRAVPVTLGPRLGDRQVVEGPLDGQRVVWEGAFFVASEAAKGDFDPHNH
ncbi:efflux RND transporter periplasmic adaptor subunit [Isoalcanivorax beigongshangi]|uniref:Efflux RND transporter periplasmic adaptor subunit n=1 Tax=Isoalcanivorax beigongshangi TaxID=3238810 RepID=A0ABV4AJS3_9GAMM